MGGIELIQTISNIEKIRFAGRYVIEVLSTLLLE